MNKPGKYNRAAHYRDFGSGYEEDERQNEYEQISEDILDLADFLIAKHPNSPVTTMHRMFSIGFRCGQRSERITKKKGEKND